MREDKWEMWDKSICDKFANVRVGANVLLKVTGSSMTALVLCTLRALHGGGARKVPPR